MPIARCSVRWAFLLVGASCSVAQEPLTTTKLSESVIQDRLALVNKKNPERHDVLVRLFQQAGCDGSFVEQSYGKRSQPNLLCTLNSGGSATILVGAHYDTHPRSQGVVDNWSGAALLPSLFQSLKNSPRKHTFLFVSFSGEEQGLVGSRHFVHDLPAEDRAHLAAIVNLDSLGLAATNVWVSHLDKQLAQWLIAVANTLKLPLNPVEFHRGVSTDSESFGDLKVPRITISSVDQFQNPPFGRRSNERDQAGRVLQDVSFVECLFGLS